MRVIAIEPPEAARWRRQLILFKLNLMSNKRLFRWAIASSIVLSGWAISPTQAQSPLFDINLPVPSQIRQDPKNQVDSECVRLDGYCIFRVAAPQSDLQNRVQTIEQALKQVKQTYLERGSAELTLEVRRPPEAEGESATDRAGEASPGEEPLKTPEIYARVGDTEPIRLMLVTELDAQLKSVDLDTATQLFVEQLRTGLERARLERQTPYLMRQGGVAVGTGAIVLVASITIYRAGKRLRRSKAEVAPSGSPSPEPLSMQLSQRQQWNLREVQHRLFQLAQTGLLVGGSAFILSRFPMTRPLPVFLVESLQIPLKLGLVALGTYVAIRLSYALINRFTSALAQSSLLTPEFNQRLQLRVKTVSGVTRGIVTISAIAIGSVVALWAIGVNIAPLLAGVGIIGVAVSLASQSLIKDAINGFFIILEDQYAVGDVISLDEDKVGGLVENMNLRITQLRDAQGRLITIPNSEIKLVANHSNGWSRADLSIPIAYQTKAETALVLVDTVAQQMCADEHWREQILDKPEVLGVDAFGERGVIIRVWIKTQPLKQWDVAREFRLRIKAALDEAGIPIPSHIDFRSHESLPVQSQSDRQALPSVSGTEQLKSEE
jgi:small conductance mechanosensitive channel